MELEQRVKTLEYEIKILKNEIQRTLLDIHEQVLIHYYPSLRLEENAPPASVTQAIQTARANRPAPAQAPAPAEPTDPVPVLPVTPANLGQPLPDAPFDASSVPVRKVSLDQLRAARSESVAAPVADKSSDSLVNMIQWAVQNAAKFGKSRMSQLIKVCGEEGLYDSAMQTVLLQVVALSKGTAPSQIVVNDVLDELLKVYRLLGRTANAEEALSLIEEAGLG